MTLRALHLPTCDRDERAASIAAKIAARKGERRARLAASRTLAEKESYEPDGARRILLTRGKVAVVDAIDYERVRHYAWVYYASKGMEYAQRRRLVGDPACGKKSNIALHRFILDCDGAERVDHIDGNGLNNRRSNLRICSQQQNCQNQRSKRNASTGLKGAARHRDGYGSTIRVNGKRLWLGLFRTPTEAARAYDAAAKLYFGEFARLNFPEAG